MKISLGWLREYVDCRLSLAELEALLRRAGLEVAGVEERGLAISNVVAAEILESVQHPNADRLSVCMVNDGSPHPRQIVCGAKNYKVGDKVPLALPGAVLPGDFKIKSGKLRGVESEGMMCSAKELRLADDAQGLLILPPATRPGTPLSELFPAETILELEITPNRSDWLSHVGVAREIAVFTGAAVTPPQPTLPKSTTQVPGLLADEADQTTHYTLRKISGVKVGPSPQWLVDRLASVGLRSVNNVVDVTNFVLFELGQPLHAFDAAKLSGSLRVRSCGEGETFQSLDGKSYPLPAGLLIIADDSGPVALAGVMGGQSTSVTESTTEIVLESASFDPVRVRRAVRATSLFSDSSYRFERGVDPEGISVASARATELILQVAGGTASDDLQTAGAIPARQQIPLSPARVRSLLGLEISDPEIEATLTRVGLKCLGSSTWEIPGFRRELQRPVDLIEEVARVAGLENVPSRTQGIFAPGSEADAAYDFAMGLRRTLAGAGFYEARTGTLLSEVDARPFGNSVALRNPLGDDQSRLRNSLLPGLFAAVRRNVDQGSKSIALFEIGRVFTPEGESEHLALVATGELEAADWRGEPLRSRDVFDLLGVVQSFPNAETRPLPSPPAPFGVAVEILVDGKCIGAAGQIHPAVARALGAPSPVLAAVFDLVLWRLLATRQTKVSPLAKFPGSTRDIAFTAPLSLPYGEVRAAILSLHEPLLESIHLFDLFTDARGEKIPADKKSLALTLGFRSPDRTLTAEEVQAATDRIKARLRDQPGLEFRE